MENSFRLIEDGSWMCRLCHAILRTKIGITTHLKTVHLKEKNYSCRFCGNLFTRSSHARAHERRIHINRSPGTSPSKGHSRGHDKNWGYQYYQNALRQPSVQHGHVCLTVLVLSWLSLCYHDYLCVVMTVRVLSWLSVCYHDCPCFIMTVRVLS